MESAAGPSLRHLRIFEMVSRLKSVRKAADSVHLSQPAVTQAITKLEEQVGNVLFERRSSGTYLTPAGEIFAVRIGSMFQQIEDALASFGCQLSRGTSLSALVERISRPQIRSLSAIADGRSFADAARKLGISQASLHRAARDLERALGKPLFHNSVYGVTTTRAGAELARKLSLAMRELEWAIEEMNNSVGIRGGELLIGAMPLAGSYLLAPVLGEITKLFPETRVRVHTGDGVSLTKSLLLGEIDFVVGLLRERIETDEFVQESLETSPYVLVARKNHPLSQKKKIHPKDLEGYEWILPTNRATRREAFDFVFNLLSTKPKANIETYSLSTIRILLTGSDRLTLLTRFEYEYEKNAGAMITLPFEPIRPIHSVGIIQRAKWNPTSLGNEFLRLIRNHSKANANRKEYTDHAA